MIKYARSSLYRSEERQKLLVIVIIAWYVNIVVYLCFIFYI